MRKVIIYVFLIFCFIFLFLLQKIEHYSKVLYFSISNCYNDSRNFLFPKYLEEVKFLLKNKKIYVYAYGKDICYRNLNAPENYSVIVFSIINNKTFISSRNLEVFCKNKLLHPLNLSVECCKDEDCPSNYICLNYACVPKYKEAKYEYIYPTLELRQNIPKCKGEVIGKYLIGEDVGPICYLEEIIELKQANISNFCKWVDGIKIIEIKGDCIITLKLYDYYGRFIGKIKDKINREKMLAINNDVIRKICIYYNGSLEKIKIKTYRYLIYFRR